MAGKEDDLMDFFDFRKPFKKVYIQCPTSRANVAVDPLSEPPEMEEGKTDKEKEKIDQEKEKEWKFYQDKVNRDLLRHQRLQMEGAASACGSIKGRSVVRPGMSGIEGDTFVESLDNLSMGGNRDGADLTKLFNFSKRSQEVRKLPIMEDKERILDTITGNPVTVLTGHTGCGKSTQVPQYLLDKLAKERKHVNIIVTQPRKIAARSLATRVCQERGWKLGGLVGYQVGLDKENKSPDTRLLYVTTGILKRMLVNKKNLNEWTHVILDEVHEREEDMDLVMLICKKLLFTNSRATKLILMSATMEDLKFTNYFSFMLPGFTSPVHAPLVSVGHKTGAGVQEYYWDTMHNLLKSSYPNVDIFPKFDVGEPQLFDSAVKMCRVLIEKLDGFEEVEMRKAGSGQRRLPGAVLVFLPGLHEIKLVRDFLMQAEDEDHGKKRFPEWKCLALHSSIPWEEHNAIFPCLGYNQRKIILSTNIAESSLTIPDIRYVVDFCLTKNQVADKDTNYPRLVLAWASHQQLIQRAGRAGRVSKDGRVYRLCPQLFYNKLPEFHPPEIQRIPLDKVILDVKMLDMGSPKELLALALDPPDIKNMQKTLLSLKEIGALLTTVNGHQSRDDGDLTVLGEIVARLPVDVRLGKLIVFGHIFNVLEEAVIIASGLNGKSIFTAPFDQRVQAYKNKLHWADRTFSDCFAILLAYQTWERNTQRGEFHVRDGLTDRESVWCKGSFLQRKQLLEMKSQVEEITRSLDMMDIRPLQIQNPVVWDPEYKFFILRLVMFGAFYPNYFIKTCSSELESQANRVLLGRDPKNTVYMHGFSQDQAVFGELYAEQVKRIFRPAIADEDLIKLSFEGSYIFVEFDRSLGEMEKSMSSYKNRELDRNLTGDISSQVYVSVKLRNQSGSNRHSVKMYNPDVAHSKFYEWQEAIKVTSRSALTTEFIEQVSPPAMSVTTLVIEPVHISSPSVFWIQYGDGAQEKDARLQEIISSCLDKLSRVERPDQVKRGGLYIAPYKDVGEKDPCYYRARVNSVRETNVTVFFIDYGNMAIVNVSELLVIPPRLIQEHPDMVRIPGLALECCLAELQPSRVRNSKGLWDEEAVNRFKELMMEGWAHGKLEGSIYSVTKSGSGHSKCLVALDSIKVMTAGSKKSMEIRSVLLEECLAEQTSESFLSQQNCKDRHNYQAYHSAMQRHLDNYEKYETRAVGLRPAKEEVRKLNVKCPLNGPYSPLEHKVQCLHRYGSTKMAAVDPESVNSVMLHQSPHDSYDHYMMSAHVAMNPSSETLLLRNTSWLPAIPGLGAFAIMMFSPQVELRTNTEKTRLTGCVSGLGPKTDWKKPVTELTKAERTEAFHPSHDIETRFDVNVTNDDIDTINKIRYWINEMLTKTEPDQIMKLTLPISLDKAQKRIKENLEVLFSRKRRLEEKVYQHPGHQYRWNMLPQHIRMPSQLSQEEFFVYKMIDGVKDIPKDNAVEAKHIASATNKQSKQ